MKKNFTLLLSKLLSKLFSNRVLNILSLVSGVLFIFAFAPFHFWGLAFLALSLQLYIWINTYSLLQAYWRGFLFGMGIYGVGLYWLFNVSHSLPDSFGPVIRAILLIIMGLLASYPAIVGLMLVWIKKHLSLHWMIVAFAFVWTLGEWLRSWVFTGLSLYQPSYAFIDTPLVGFAPVGGELLVTLMVLISVSSAFLILYIKTIAKKSLLFLLILSLWTGGWLLKQVSWQASGLKTLNVRVIHGMPDEKKKYRRFYAVDMIKLYLAYSRALPKVDLVVWPESAIAYDFDAIKHYLLPEAKNLANSGTDILLGGYIQDRNKTYNSLLMASNPDNRYDKRHLIPFGEFTPDIPFFDLREYLPSLENGALDKGNYEQPVLSIKGAKVKGAEVAVAICYEIIFGSEFRQQWIEADLLIFASDLNWFQGTWGIEQLHQIARLRSMESGKPLLSATSYGVTAIIDNKGRTLKCLEHKTGYIDETIMIGKTQTPYSVYGNRLIVMLCVFMLIAALISDRWRIKD